MASVSIDLDPETIGPIIARVVEATLLRLRDEEARVDGKLCYSESEAAALLGVEPHVLRDERRRGRIRSSSIVGRRIRYLKEDLIDYLRGRRPDDAEPKHLRAAQAS